MAGEGPIVFVSFWFFVRNFHTKCDDDCIKHRHARHARVIFLLGGGGGDIVVLMEYYVS